MQNSIGDMSKRIIIYGRVSTAEQCHDSQIAEVQDYCARRWRNNVAVTVITDTASGAKISREKSWRESSKATTRANHVQLDYATGEESVFAGIARACELAQARQIAL
jgi:predicted site-specific integrase-resolvase